MTHPTPIQFDDPRGGLTYPFLPDALRWRLISHPLNDAKARANLAQSAPPTLRWVKDNKVVDLVVPGMDSQTFLQRAGLQLFMHKGGYVLSKRLSRLMRPYRYWGFFEANALSM